MGQMIGRNRFMPFFRKFVIWTQANSAEIQTQVVDSVFSCCYPWWAYDILKFNLQVITVITIWDSSRSTNLDIVHSATPSILRVLHQMRTDARAVVLWINSLEYFCLSAKKFKRFASFSSFCSWKLLAMQRCLLFFYCYYYKHLGLFTETVRIIL